MMRRHFDYMFEVDEFVEKLVNNGHYGEFVVITHVNGGYCLYW